MTSDLYQGDQKVYLRETAREKKADATSSQALWEVEIVGEDRCRGGIATWKAFFRFKHLSTGHYLAMVEDKDETKDESRARLSGARTAGERVTLYHMITIKDPTNLATVFEIDPTNIPQVCLLFSFSFSFLF